MKKILAILLLTFGATAIAHGPHYHGYWRHGGDNRWYWLAPVVVGGVVAYEMSRPQQPIIINQAPPPVVYQQQNCSPWTQIQNPDGTTTMTRTCYGIQ